MFFDLRWSARGAAQQRPGVPLQPYRRLRHSCFRPSTRAMELQHWLKLFARAGPRALRDAVPAARGFQAQRCGCKPTLTSRGQPGVAAGPKLLLCEALAALASFGCACKRWRGVVERGSCFQHEERLEKPTLGRCVRRRRLC